MDTCSNTNVVIDDNFISNLGRTFSESLQIQDAQKFDKEADPSVIESESLFEHSAHQTYSRSISLPLISALKGSREKHRGSQVKLNVKWAPDVYDPVPTLLSHTVRIKKKQQQRPRKKPEKKNGKKGQKGNSSRGGSSKDKQFRKLGGASGLCYKSMDFCDKVVLGPSTEIDAIDVRSQNSYCGTSFLKKSMTEVHYSVAEAL